MTDYYDNVLQILQSHLSSRNDVSLDLLGAVVLLTEVVETEPNVDKRLVTEIYDELRHRIEEQFESIHTELAAKENTAQLIAECDQDINGLDEAKALTDKIIQY